LDDDGKLLCIALLLTGELVLDQALYQLLHEGFVTFVFEVVLLAFLYFDQQAGGVALEVVLFDEEHFFDNFIQSRNSEGLVPQPGSSQ
jgi:hypothetical protein